MPLMMIMMIIDMMMIITMRIIMMMIVMMIIIMIIIMVIIIIMVGLRLFEGGFDRGSLNKINHCTQHVEFPTKIPVLT